MFENFIKDARFSLRKSVKHPAFSLIVIVLLAIGIGMNTALFSVVNAVLLRPLPYHAPHQIVYLEDNLKGHNLTDLPISAPEFVDYSKQTQLFRGVAIYDDWEATLGSSGARSAQRFQGAVVSASLFHVLGVSPLEGRLFLNEENRAGANNEVILSYDFWKQRFNRNPAVVGTTVSIDSASYKVVGVMPSGFFFPDRETVAWTPIPFHPEDFTESERGSRSYLAIARLATGISLERAEAGMQTVAARLKAEYPNEYADSGWAITLRPLTEVFTGDTRRPLLMLLGAAGFILLIVCANLSNLLLSRAAAWRKEVDIRIALGGTRSRIVSQFLTESGVLLFFGALLGLLIAPFGKKVILDIVAAGIVRPQDVSIDLRVLLFVLALSLFTGLTFGLGPAFYSYNRRLTESLREVQGTGAKSSQRFRDVLMVAEVSLSLILLIGAGLMIKSLRNLQNVKTGFDPSNVLTMKSYLPVDAYPDPRRIEFYRELLNRVSSLPGVQSAGMINQLPLGGGRSDRTFVIKGRPVSPETAPDEEYRVVYGDYFQALRIPLERGRYFSSSDTEKAPKVLIINQSMARKYWPNSDPIGASVSYYAGPGGPLEWRQIIGIVANVRHFGLDLQPKPEFYVPYEQHPKAFMTLVLRSNIPQSVLAASVRAAVDQIDRNQAIYDISPMTEVISNSIKKQRVSTLLLSLFAFVALFLSSIGLYGAVSYLVTQRTREFGVRIAIGASNRDILLWILRHGMLLVCVGLVIGLSVAFALTRVLSSFLFNVTTTDVLVLVTVPLIQCAVAAIACLVPARRALRLDPLLALRYE
jgi:putative ABC transport system permease protein